MQNVTKQSITNVWSKFTELEGEVWKEGREVALRSFRNEWSLKLQAERTACRQYTPVDKVVSCEDTN